VKEAGVPGENIEHGQATGKLYHLWLRVECTLLVILYRSKTRTPKSYVVVLFVFSEFG
jgi:hypothetical protein